MPLIIDFPLLLELGDMTVAVVDGGGGFNTMYFDLSVSWTELLKLLTSSYSIFDIKARFADATNWFCKLVSDADEFNPLCDTVFKVADRELRIADETSACDSQTIDTGIFGPIRIVQSLVYRFLILSTFVVFFFFLSKLQLFIMMIYDSCVKMKKKKKKKK